jgi:hypothetical protein
MKEKILDGSFTPNSNNRNTHWNATWNDKLYRSSWEALYHQLNPSASYEELRIAYSHNNKEHIYIVDFIDHTTKEVTEVKPKELLNDRKTISKITALTEWAKANKYSVILADQEYFIKNKHKIKISEFDSTTANKIQKAFLQ